MALRTIRVEGDPVLGKVCRPITKVTRRIAELAGDMAETMYHAYGVGLAAPQVGILRRLVVIDVTGEDLFVMLNPEIIKADGEQTGEEGCLSLPGKAAKVTRPNHVVARYQDLDLNEHEVEAEGLFARAICHELDHLDGILYTEKAEGPIYEVGLSPEEDEQTEETEE